MEKGYPCPCCGYLVNDEPPGSYNICPICFWEDDPGQLMYPLIGGGANQVSLLEGQKNYLAFGACEERVKQYVRSPLPDEQRAEEWRSIDQALDSCIEDPLMEDPQQRSKYRMFLSDVRRKHSLDAFSGYYWSPTYWRQAIKAEQQLAQQQTLPPDKGNQ